jgi:hypothetical protein
VNPRPCSGPTGCTYDEKFDRYGCDQAVADAPADPSSAGGGKKGGKKH